MASDILMPVLSPNMTEGKLTRWLKKPGDVVVRGEPIAEVETDKAIVEVEATEQGVLGEIRVPEGSERVPVNAVIATLIAIGETQKADSPAMPEATIQPIEAAIPATLPRASAEAGTTLRCQQPRTTAGDRVIASPLARRVAKERGINLTDVIGTGPQGRVVEIDVEGVDQGVAQQLAATVGLVGAGQQSTETLGARQWADLAGMSYEFAPNSTIRKTIARRMLEAKQNIPHYYITLDCRIDALLELQKRHCSNRADKISLNDVVIRACALALRKVPGANVSWTEEGILAYGDVDIAVAVSIPGGLITPIMRRADSKSVGQIAGEMRDLVARARIGKLKPVEYEGGTFSISNLGMFGIREFAAIINPPQACILAVGSAEQRAVVDNGAVVVATVMTCTLSVDHRAIDGALGAQYLSAFKNMLEDPHDLFV
ncbi:MAG TPA: pyruvate dehydrogenase complex dihydrolipoamide acetyltransferase [Steroidobacteraceae bacterium]